jgi:hypothetical protein
MSVPSIVFIIPYRDRKHHKNFFDIYIKYLLEDMDEKEYEILFVHQADKRPFNCGAMKNVGYMYIKDKYRDNYEDINLVFNDVDTLPYKKNLLNYKTNFGEVKHYYGFNYALGGIVSIKAKDFEDINGYPNYWGYGFEDNILYKRAKEVYKINREQFYNIHSNEILQFYDGIKKIIDKNNLENQFNKSYIETDGISYIKNLKYEYKDGMLHVFSFEAKYTSERFEKYIHHIFNGNKIKKKDKRFFKMELYK